MEMKSNTTNLLISFHRGPEYSGALWPTEGPGEWRLTLLPRCSAFANSLLQKHREAVVVGFSTSLKGLKVQNCHILGAYLSHIQCQRSPAALGPVLKHHTRICPHSCDHDHCTLLDRDNSRKVNLQKMLEACLDLVLSYWSVYDHLWLCVCPACCTLVVSQFLPSSPSTRGKMDTAAASTKSVHIPSANISEGSKIKTWPAWQLIR